MFCASVPLPPKEGLIETSKSPLSLAPLSQMRSPPRQTCRRSRTGEIRLPTHTPSLTRTRSNTTARYPRQATPTDTWCWDSTSSYCSLFARPSATASPCASLSSRERRVPSPWSPFARRRARYWHSGAIPVARGRWLRKRSRATTTPFLALRMWSARSLVNSIKALDRAIRRNRFPLRNPRSWLRSAFNTRNELMLHGLIRFKPPLRIPPQTPRDEIQESLIIALQRLLQCLRARPPPAALRADRHARLAHRVEE